MALRRKQGTESDPLFEGPQSLPKTPIYPNAFAVFAAVGVGFIMIAMVVIGVVVGTRTADIQNKVGTIVSIPVNDSCATLGVEQRRSLAYQKRLDNAFYQYSQPVACHDRNNDEVLYQATQFASFSKGLQHDALGHVNLVSYALLKKAATTGLASDWDAVPLASGAVRKLTNPQAGGAFVNEGHDPRSLYQQPAPAFASAEQAGEMVEMYWMALTRDVNFVDYATDVTIAQAAASMATLSDFRGPVTTAALFRGVSPGCDVGPYISQFMYLPCVFGANTIDMRLYPPTSGVDFMTTVPTYLDQQNAQPIAAPLTYGPNARYIINGRDLSHWVHVDVLFQAYFQAMLILLSENVPMKPGLPYQTSSLNQMGFGTFGPPHVAQMSTNSAIAALKSVWFQKWAVHRRLRPEVMGMRVHSHVTSAYTYPIHADLLTSNVLAAVFGAHGTYLLPQAFPEGSPLHPSYGAGHATVAGAATTILKALFDESYILPSPVMPNPLDGGQTTVPLSPPASLTVGGELNKLANNVAIGRNIAGVHWRSDAKESLKLGEQVAIGILRDMKNTFNEPFAGWSFHDFDGNLVTV